jgi:hypothetical protein
MGLQAAVLIIPFPKLWAPRVVFLIAGTAGNQAKTGGGMVPLVITLHGAYDLICWLVYLTRQPHRHLSPSLNPDGPLYPYSVPHNVCKVCKDSR